MASKRKVHIVTYTHWDREFRWEFERTRMRLVDCLDSVLDILAKKPEYGSFLMDGQLTVVEDYLEIRPENRARIAELVKQGRCEVGPWFTLPDCAPIQGESLVRNLMYGFRKSQEFGSVLKCGYNVFSFGQVAQLPQIYAHFGIDTILFYKHLEAKKTKYHEFIWEAPDGTRALASRLGKEARWNFFFAGHIPIVYDRDAWHKDWQYKWGDFGKIFHTADPASYGWFYDVLDPETTYHPENIKKGMDRAMKTVEGTAAPEVVLLFEGTDFTEPHPLTTDIIQEIRKQYPDLDIVHSTLSAYVADLKAALKGRTDLDVISGPMRDGPVGAIHTDVFSIHPEIMIANSAAENTILRWAEPLSSMAWMLGVDRYPTTYLDKLWKLVFQSHVHDSMHGLGPKTLGEGVIARLQQAHLIAMGLERRGLQNITKEIATDGVSDTEFFVAVHNPSSFARSEVVEAFLDVPRDVRLNYLVLEDMAGNPVAVQEVDRKETRAGLYHPRSRNMPFYCTRVHLHFLASDIPALGYKTFKLKWAQKNEYPYPHEDWDAPRIPAHTLVTGPMQAENEFLRVKVNADGTFALTDKQTGKTFEQLNYFLDAGDKGNMWMSDSPGNDQVINSLGRPARISLTTQGPLVTGFAIEVEMTLPAEYDWQNQTRSSVTRTMPIRVELTLRKGSKHLDVKTTVKNTVRDHFFKVCFPTGLAAEKTWAEGSFAVAEFPVKPSVAGDLRGSELARHPAQLWFDLYDGKNGLAVLSNASKDYEILENVQDQTLAMALVRSVRLRIPCDNRLWMEYPGDESSQSLDKEFTYGYALLPHSKQWDKSAVCESALAFNAPMHVCQFGKQKGTLPAAKSFLALKGDNLVLSGVKKAVDRDSIIVRLYNPSTQEQDATLTVGFPLQQANIVGINEDNPQPLKIQNGEIHFKAGKGKIITLELVPTKADRRA